MTSLKYVHYLLCILLILKLFRRGKCLRKSYVFFCSFLFWSHPQEYSFQANLNLFKMNLDRGATFLFPCLFLMFNFCYWTFYLVVMPKYQKDYQIEQEDWRLFSNKVSVVQNGDNCLQHQIEYFSLNCEFLCARMQEIYHFCKFPT